LTGSAPQTGPDYGFGLYLHWPYCTKICPYCDFNVYTAKDRETGPLLEAMLADLRAHKSRMPEHPKLDTVFLGGGTPSLMTSQQMLEVMEAAQETFGLAQGAEITLEANPNDVLGGDLEGWRRAGVTRLSIGVQSLRDDALTFLGRDHDSRNARAATEAALAVFPSVSIDLIYARPGQTDADWVAELGDALELGAHHISLYELTIEERTAFGKAAARGALTPMDDDAQADLYEVTQRVTQAAGYRAYEVSNHAIAEAHQSRHNMLYWRSGDWVGVGPGAHGRLTLEGQRLATEAARRPGDYIEASAPSHEVLSQLEVTREALAMGLRPTCGIEMDRVPGIDEAALAELTAQGVVEVADGWLRVTAQGRLLTDAIVARLAP